MTQVHSLHTVLTIHHTPYTIHTRWNDEGETSWYTYILWNQAQADQYTINKPNTRHFTINRAWQPGMQRYPAISWTGDGQSCTHQELLRGMMNGCPLTSCDLTSPDATTLVRQYQSAVFTPIMRVHEMQGTPRFPWFWPDPHDKNTAPDEYDEHQRAFQVALGMRYTFLPYLYSLAHASYRYGRPIGHPASFVFTSACTVPTSQQCIDAENTYMVGSTLIPSDLGLAHTNLGSGHPPLENSSTAILPAGTSWYRWNQTAALKGGQTIKETLKLAEMAVFVRAGAVLPLQTNTANGSIQRSAEAGGTLEVQVYAGSDGSFEMVEDDGISLDYRTSPDTATRTTTWKWSDATKTLTWAVQGGLQIPSPYSTVAAVLFEDGVAEPQRAAQQPLGARSGKVVFH
jgi:alpha-glucosidase